MSTFSWKLVQISMQLEKNITILSFKKFEAIICLHYAPFKMKAHYFF